MPRGVCLDVGVLRYSNAPGPLAPEELERYGGQWVALRGVFENDPCWLDIFCSLELHPFLGQRQPVMKERFEEIYDSEFGQGIDRTVAVTSVRKLTRAERRALEARR